MLNIPANPDSRSRNPCTQRQLSSRTPGDITFRTGGYSQIRFLYWMRVDPYSGCHIKRKAQISEMSTDRGSQEWPPAVTDREMENGKGWVTDNSPKLYQLTKSTGQRKPSVSKVIRESGGSWMRFQERGIEHFGEQYNWTIPERSLVRNVLAQRCAQCHSGFFT